MFDERSPTEISSGMKTEARKTGQREEVARMRSLVRRYRFALDEGDSETARRLKAEISRLAGPEGGSATRSRLKRA